MAAGHAVELTSLDTQVVLVLGFLEKHHSPFGSRVPKSKSMGDGGRNPEVGAEAGVVKEHCLRLVHALSLPSARLRMNHPVFETPTVGRALSN